MAVTDCVHGRHDRDVLVGICLPALLIGFTQPTTAIIYAAIWLLCMKFISQLVASHHNGLHRIGDAVIMLLYLLFALAIMLWY
jgi:hypothetical protein